MPVATPDQYAEMLDTAKKTGFAFPAINVSSSQTINAVLQGLTEAGSDGIIQVTTGGADYFAGQTVKARAAGALAFAAFAPRSPRTTPSPWRCTPITARRMPSAGSSSRSSRPQRPRSRRAATRSSSRTCWRLGGAAGREPRDPKDPAADEGDQRDLEVEIGVVGGEEDGVGHEINEHLYTTLDDAIATVDALGLGDQGRYMAALTFGNVHGVYAPGNVKLTPELLKENQDGLAAEGRNRREAARPCLPRRLRLDRPGDRRRGLVWSGEDDIDTDTQYAFTRSIAGTMFANYDGVLKVDGGVGNKKIYDPRAWGKIAEAAMAARVAEATRQLGSAGRSITRIGAGCRSTQDAGTPDEPAPGDRRGGLARRRARAARRAACVRSYGEYAPEGWTWTPPADVHAADEARAAAAAAAATPGAPGAPAPAAPPVVPRRVAAASARADGTARPPGRPRRDDPAAGASALFGAWLSVGVLQALPQSMRAARTPRRASSPTRPGPRCPASILTGSIVQVRRSGS